ncbi:PREDICTED: zinc transporter ZIP12-like [Branchiostoma belcheri]|uniref:Zinc transporter ZIP12-like n=1 Tax=Branchiostoma belcheri TaxID=7741 RepID=A0A6P4Z7J7_BRABE|nr:PREDICTED: zinc transporter ZIP12-like [Branchiostoma belcheri]
MLARLIFLACLLALIGLVASQHDDHAHEGEEPFHEVLELLGAEENSTTLTTAHVEDLVGRLKARVRCSQQDLGPGVTCATCLTATSLIQAAAGDNSATTLDEEGFHNASVILLLYLTDLAGVCKNETDPSAKGLSWFEDRLLQYTHSTSDDRLSDHSFEHVLEDIQTNYTVENWGQCFSAESVFTELNITNTSGGATRQELGEVAAITVVNVLKGWCIGQATLPQQGFFLDHLFELLNATNGVITAAAFEGMFTSLGIGGDSHGHAEEEGEDAHDHRRRRDVGRSRVKRASHEHEHDHEGAEFEQTCFSPDQLMQLYLVDEESGLTQAQFKEITPAIVQQVYSKVCAAQDTPTTTRLTEAESEYCPHMCWTMLQNGINFNSWSWLFMQEQIDIDNPMSTMNGEKPATPSHEKKMSVSKQQLTNAESTVTVDQDAEGQDEDDPKKKHYVCCKGFTSLAMLIIIGDGMHNLSDGLAIGIAFAGSLSVGVSTSIAVLAHELPHEIGDFAILLKCGMSYKQALLWNFISAMAAFLGLYIGLAIGSDISNRQWIFAIIAGMFLYIALVDMMPELAEHKSKRPVVTFIVQNVGFLLGVVALLMLALYEDQIQVSLT